MSSEIKTLPGWRSVIRPQSDVREGNFKNAEFAADLSQIVRSVKSAKSGKSEGRIEYLDPVEFFRRTYITEGIKGLLTQALRRASGKDGEPVIQLKTAFGGGKTHSMFALYHFMRNPELPEKIPELRSVLDEAGVSSIPKTNVAVIVGTAEDASKPHESKNLPGVKINTIWGEIAAQLAGNAGDSGLYDKYVRTADENSVSPGSRNLQELFDSCGTCLILIDEIAAYARKLSNRNDLPAGTFGNFLTFIQEITEAAKSSRNSMIAAAIPESNIEIGGDDGKEILSAVEHTFGRMEAIWKPVAANEGFEIVRRRLFEDCEDSDSRLNVANTFSRMYSDNKKDFPSEACEIDYRDRIISCYPIHPEIFDRLYEDWATLEKFQRTRGVLRLMAAVIHELWMSSDNSPLIMPGSIPLDVSNVRAELIRYLQPGWDSIVEKEVDGKDSTPYKTDKEIPRFGNKSAARRVARSVMLGSAPASRYQAVRGIDKRYIRLGVVQPGENIADFNDALGTLQGELAYLYTDSYGNRFWYDTRPTLLKTVKDRAAQISDYEVNHEIISRLKRLRSVKPFAGVHLYSGSTGDIPDGQSARLVILGPDYEYDYSLRNESPAVKACSEILNNRGNSDRHYRNMLLFLAPDKSQIEGLRQETRLYLAWGYIDSDREKLNLDASQVKETRINLERCNNNIELQISESWCWLLVPKNEKTDIKTILWDSFRISSGAGNTGIIERVAGSAAASEALITNFAPVMLNMELDGLLWKDRDDISVKKLWEYFSMYLYLPRLAGYEVLKASIISGVSSGEYFALAESKTDGKYNGIEYNCPVNANFSIESAYLVKKEAALKSIETPEPDKPEAERINNNSHEVKKTSSNHEPVSSSFYLSVSLDGVRISRDIQNVLNEIIPNFKGSKIKMSLEVKVDSDSPDGFSQSVISTVEANCEALKFTDFSFN